MPYLYISPHGGNTPLIFWRTCRGTSKEIDVVLVPEDWIEKDIRCEVESWVRDHECRYGWFAPGTRTSETFFKKRLRDEIRRHEMYKKFWRGLAKARKHPYSDYEDRTSDYGIQQALGYLLYHYSMEKE